MTLALTFFVQSQMIWGQLPEDTTRAEFVRERFHQGYLTTWLDAMGDHTVVQGLHTGHWDERSQLIFSVDGNSYRWNRYYIDGFRLDNRFQAGSTLYVPSLENYDMRINTRSSELHFDLDTTQYDHVSVSWNMGDLGGISRGTSDIVHLFHGTGTEGAYDRQLIQHRQHVHDAGTADVAYTFRDSQGKAYRQHIMVTAGEQQYPNYNQDGLLPAAPLYPSDAYKVQLDGQLPSGRWLERLGYWVNVSGTENYGADFYRNRAEVCDLRSYSASLYGRRRGLTTGLTWATHVNRHEDLSFTRNIIDQDGEAMEPWMSDGRTHELTWALTYERRLLPWLQISVEGYNSLLRFQPREERFTNDIYLQHMLAPVPVPLFRYEWNSHDFSSGLLENRAVLEAHHTVTPRFSINGSLGMSLDGMLLDGRSKVSPNLLAGFSLDYRPTKWLHLGLSISHERISYNIEDIRFMSRDYMNAHIYHAGTNRLFSTTGGAYHTYRHHLQQPAYVTLDVPIRLRFGRHEIALLQTYKKFYHTWMAQFQGGSEANGFYDNGNFYLNDGLHEYIVDYTPTSLMGTGLLTNTPYYMSQLSRYTYVGRKVIFSLSWQSMMCVGLSALGNGPVSNNIGVLSETTANPNTLRNLGNPTGAYPAVGRLDQDKAYVCRIYLGYNVCRNFRFGVTGRWTDGQPFSFFNTATYTDANGNTQVAINPRSSRGINPTDGNFGCRESAIFNIDIHAQVRWMLHRHAMSLNLLCYNAYDFGNVLTEYTFPQGVRGDNARGPNMTLTIPRGIIATLKIDL